MFNVQRKIYDKTCLSVYDKYSGGLITTGVFSGDAESVHKFIHEIMEVYYPNQLIEIVKENDPQKELNFEPLIQLHEEKNHDSEERKPF